jgi:hypothetical protein
MNYRILLSVFIAFSIVFGSLFFIFFNPITVESNTNQYPAFSLTLDKKSQNLFLLGSSHIGHLNSSLIVNSIHESYPSTSIFNLATNGDTPNRRISDLSYITNMNPEFVFYGVSFRDFNSPNQFTSKYFLPDLKLLVDQSIPEPLESLNPQFISRTIIKDILQNYGLMDVSKYDINPTNTPFFSLGNLQTIILEEPELERLLLTTDPSPQSLHLPLINNDQVDSFKKIIQELNNNNIKVIIFTVPIHELYLDNISTENKLSFNQILNDISDEYDVKIYNFTNNYSKLKIWNNLDHIAYNEHSDIFSKDISKMILTELRK